MGIRILLADGNESLRLQLHALLSDEGYETDLVCDGISAIKHFRRFEYSLAILDTRLPELDGKSVCRQIHKMSDIPFILISSDSDEQSKLSGYDLGAEDYIVKPFSFAELLAKIKVILRRGAERPEIFDRNIVYDGLFIDTAAHTVFVEDKRVLLTPKEYHLLILLARHPNQTFSREMLLDKVWGADFMGTDRTVDTHVKTLREAIRPKHNFIETVRGVGYKFSE